MRILKFFILIFVVLIMSFSMVGAGKQLGRYKTISISPESAIIDAGASQSYSCGGFDKKGNSLGDITALTHFTIDQDAGGSWQKNVYTAESPGLWTVTAKFRRCIARASLTVNEIPSPHLPPPIVEGTLYRTFGEAAEYEDVTALVYNRNAKPWVRINSNEGAKDYLLPNCDRPSQYYVKAILTSRSELWVAFGVPITINQYHIGVDGLSLLSTVGFGDDATRLANFIRLSSGKLLVSWYQHVANLKDAEGNLGINVGFAYRDTVGVWKAIPYTWLYPNTHPTHATVCQHPDGSIWWFSASDGNHTIKVIHLIESVEDIVVDWVDYRFLSQDDGIDMEPEGELPWITSVADPNSNVIILAYQDMNREWFSYDPFVKGANVAVVQCNSDGSRNLLFVLDRWLERTIQFNVGITPSNDIWLAYGMIDANALTWNDLYISEDDIHRYMGKLKNGIPKQARVTFCNSSKWLIANMDDGCIHFFNL